MNLPGRGEFDLGHLPTDAQELAGQLLEVPEIFNMASAGLDRFV